MRFSKTDFFLLGMMLSIGLIDLFNSPSEISVGVFSIFLFIGIGEFVNHNRGEQK